MNDTTEIIVCTECAVIIANGDDSMDGGAAKAESLAAMGGHMVVLDVAEGDAQMFRCGGCDDDVMSDVVRVEWTVRAG